MSLPCWIRSGRSTRLLRWVLGGMFLLAGWAKLSEPNAFLASLMNYGYFEANFAYAISRVLPWLEVVVGVWLVIGWRPLGAALMGTALTAAFTVVLVAAWWQGLTVECVCFGPVSLGRSPAAGVLRNSVLLAAFVWLSWRCARRGKKVFITP